LFEHIIHSWIGYELVKVILKYGLNPGVQSNLHEWSQDLSQLFSYFGEKTRDPTKRPDTQINILFDNTEHNSYFAKLSLGSKRKFEKMPNRILPLVLLTWLRQLQEYFFKQPDTSTHADWSNLGRYIAQPAGKQVNKGVNHVYLSGATPRNLTKMKSFDDIMPKNKGKGVNKVVRSLQEWADRILSRDNDYVEDIVARSLQQRTKQDQREYQMNKKNYSKQAVHGESQQDDDIEDYAPNTMKQRSRELLLTVVSDFMMEGVEKLTKPKKKNVTSINRANEAVACLVQYVNTMEGTAFQSIDEMRAHMEAKTKNSASLAESSSDYEDECSESSSES
jgi:hypothetical protein